MSDIVIQAEGLGKKYLIGHQTERERYTALRDVLARNVRDYWRKAKAKAKALAWREDVRLALWAPPGEHSRSIDPATSLDEAKR